MANRGPTTDQLRRDIDSGRTGSKIDYPDPAAAPLGTDDEAAGTPPSAEAIAAARRHEVGGAPVQTDAQKPDAGPYVYAGLMAVIFAVLAAIALWFGLAR
jgi:hypothetical protein